MLGSFFPCRREDIVGMEGQPLGTERIKNGGDGWRAQVGLPECRLDLIPFNRLVSAGNAPQNTFEPACH